MVNEENNKHSRNVFELSGVEIVTVERVLSDL